MDANEYFENTPKKIIDFQGRTWTSEKEHMSGCIRWLSDECPEDVEVMCTPLFECEDDKPTSPIQVMIDGEVIFFEDVPIIDVDNVNTIDYSLSNALSLVHFHDSTEEAGDEDDSHEDVYIKLLAMTINCGYRDLEILPLGEGKFIKGMERALEIYLACKEQ